jgi:hypothetical protein
MLWQHKVFLYQHRASWLVLLGVLVVLLLAQLLWLRLGLMHCRIFSKLLWVLLLLLLWQGFSRGSIYGRSR